jgi:hypothetical protein
MLRLGGRQRGLCLLDLIDRLALLQPQSRLRFRPPAEPAPSTPGVVVERARISSAGASTAQLVLR